VENEGVGKSYRVTEITREEILDIFEAREAVECNALRLSMETGITPEQLESLKRINSRMEEQNKAGNIRLQFSYDQSFHNTLMSCCRNRRLKRFYDSIRVQLERMRVLSYLESSYQEKAYNDHMQILAQIEAGNREEAVRALLYHIRTSKRDYCELIEHKVSLDSYGMLRFLMKNMKENTCN
jgi:DNA-binding GntR family transcriptional regulator